MEPDENDFKPVPIGATVNLSYIIRGTWVPD